MAKNKSDRSALEELKTSVASGQLGRLYLFHGAERYLLEYYLEKIKSLLITGDFSEFNYRRYDGESLSVDTLTAACDTMPAFSERTLIEVHDFDVANATDENKKKLSALFSDLPEYVCLIFVCGILSETPDGSPKLMKEFKKAAKVVDFGTQEPSKLIKWIKEHFAANGRTIDTPTAEYLAMVTGGLMTSMNTEIEKVSAYSAGGAVTRAQIDAVVTPVLDAVVYRMTDHIASGNFSAAASVMDELLRMNEKPHYLIFSITLKLRQLLTARCCLEAGMGEKGLMSLCGIKYDWQARSLMSSARKSTVRAFRQAVSLSAEAAYRMNSGTDPEVSLTELLIGLAANSRRVGV